jgi:hypothetical protein
MSEPKTPPHGFTVPCHAPPSAAHYAWLGRAEDLLLAFERSLPAASGAAPVPTLGFILMVADYLWDCWHEAADFAKLDVQGFVAHNHVLLCVEGVAEAFASTLTAFYGFLATSAELDAALAKDIAAQLSAAALQLAERS